MRTRRHRALAIPMIALLIGLLVAQADAGAAEKELTYDIAHARAFAAKLSVPNEVVNTAEDARNRARVLQQMWEAECLARTGDAQCRQVDSSEAKCMPDRDTYGCDSNRYNRTPNCPSGIAIGRHGPVRLAQPPPGSTPRTGGAGVDGGPEPRQSTPVRLNFFPSHAHLGRGGFVLDSGGFASKAFTDLAGRDEPEAHASTDGFITTLNQYEERCWAGKERDPPVSTGEPKPIGSEYSHVLSRSGDGPDTYNLSECREGQCSFGGEDPFSAEKAETIVYLHESGGKLFGRLSASVQGFSFGGGVFTADSLFTLVNFETSGTRGGLKWEALSTATNTKIGGQQVPMQAGDAPRSGQLPNGEQITVSVAAPYVKTPNDGSSLVIVAPGTTVSMDRQASYFGGAELTVKSIGLEEPFSFIAGGFGSAGFTSSSAPFLTGGESGALLGGGAALNGSTVTPSGRVVAVKRLHVGPWPVIAILGFGFLTLLVLIAGWIRRFGWGRRVFSFQPLRSFDWLHRAFVKT